MLDGYVDFGFSELSFFSVVQRASDSIWVAMSLSLNANACPQVHENCHFAESVRLQTLVAFVITNPSFPDVLDIQFSQTRPFFFSTTEY